MGLKPFYALAQNAELLEVGNLPLAVLNVPAIGDEIGVVHLVHGFTGSKEDFWEMAAIVAQSGFRVVAHDNRGQHQSGHATSYLLDDFAHDVLEVETALGLKNTHLLGHSFGGLVARRAVLLDPDQFQSLTFLCSGPGKNERRRLALSGMVDFLADKTMAEAWSMQQQNYIPDIMVNPHPDETSVWTHRWHLSDKYSLFGQAEILMNEVDRTEELYEIGIPAHVVYGENDDAWPLELQDEMAERLEAERSIIKFAGHCPNEEMPAVTAAVLSAWWREFH
ncbi:MAG: hypothetical protein RIS09_332 [Actinomycetota bacterium]|jgi:pimeloyl-ACP methyl ester carboxylesterase